MAPSTSAEDGKVLLWLYQSRLEHKHLVERLDALEKLVDETTSRLDKTIDGDRQETVAGLSASVGRLKTIEEDQRKHNSALDQHVRISAEMSDLLNKIKDEVLALQLSRTALEQRLEAEINSKTRLEQEVEQLTKKVEEQRGSHSAVHRRALQAEVPASTSTVINKGSLLSEKAGTRASHPIGKPALTTTQVNPGDPANNQPVVAPRRERRRPPMQHVSEPYVESCY